MGEFQLAVLMWQGFLLIAAAAAKVRTPRRFAMAVAGYRLAPSALVKPLAWSVPGVEVILGAGLISGDAEDQSPIPSLPGWVVVGATSATALKSRFQVQGTPYGVVTNGDGRVPAVGIPNKAVDIRRPVEAAERHSILSRPARLDHGAGTQQAAPAR